MARIKAHGYPAGQLPNSFVNWTLLANMHLESTAMGGLPDSLFTSLPKLTTLTLVKNGQMNQNLPQSLSGSALQNLYALFIMTRSDTYLFA